MVGIMKNGYDDAFDQHAVRHQQSYFVIALGSGMRYAARVNGVGSGGRMGSGGGGGRGGGGWMGGLFILLSYSHQVNKRS